MLNKIAKNIPVYEPVKKAFQAGPAGQVILGKKKKKKKKKTIVS